MYKLLSWIIFLLWACFYDWIYSLGNPDEFLAGLCREYWCYLWTFRRITKTAFCWIDCAHFEVLLSLRITRLDFGSLLLFMVIYMSKTSIIPGLMLGFLIPEPVKRMLHSDFLSGLHLRLAEQNFNIQYKAFPSFLFLFFFLFNHCESAIHLMQTLLFTVIKTRTCPTPSFMALRICKG